MQKSIISIFISIAAGILIGILAGYGSVPVIFAAQDDLSPFESSLATTGEEGHKLIGCFRNLQDFLASIVGYQDFAEYWIDIVRINLCHRTDIDFVERQLNKARRLVRNAFLRCETQNIRRLIDAYHKLEVELFFLREAFSEKKNADVEYLLRNEDGSRNDRKWNELLAKLLQKSKRWIYFGADPFEDESLLNAYFQEFDAKYLGRLDTYNNCRSETWEEIGDKLEELVENFRKFGRSAARSGEAIGREVERGFEDSRRSGPILSTEDGFNLNLKIARLNVAPEKSFREIIEPAEDIIDIFSELGEGTASQRSRGSQPPHIEIPSRIAKEKTRFKEQMSRAELEAKFTTLYADLNDNAVNAISKKLSDLIQTVNTSMPLLDTIEQCVDEVEAKECKNKK